MSAPRVPPQPPSVLVTRRLPEAVEARLTAQFRTMLSESDEPVRRDALEAAMREHDALLTTITDRIDAALIASEGRRVRIIANFGTGTDHIDVDAARRAGIVVTNTPDALTEAAAEMTILLMLMAARRAGEGERVLRAGEWEGWGPTHMIGQGLAGRTLGLVGFGRIAQRTAAKARGLGMSVRYFSRSRAPAEVETELGATPAESLAALAAEADVLSLHVPGGPATRHLIDREMLTRMKPTAILVNTARGSVVDEAALAEALAERRIGAAGLDVYEREPEVEPMLLLLPNVVLLPHLGSATIEARTAMGMQAADNLEDYFSGRQPRNRVA
ncbi:MAG: 2-hydroxyacid dehydrogenase [Rhizomicrobium sp.]|jgi:lactate dehydrogenase-like 2-hydroxyacid dehydrogenase